MGLEQGTKPVMRSTQEIVAWFLLFDLSNGNQVALWRNIRKEDWTGGEMNSSNILLILALILLLKSQWDARQTFVCQSRGQLEMGT